MAKRLRIFTDGSYNHEDQIAGWAYVIVSGDTVLSADCGIVECMEVNSNSGEHLAAMHALFALPTKTTAMIVSDLDSLVGLINGQEFKYGKRRLGKKRLQVQKEMRKLKDIIRKLCSTHDIIAQHVRSGRHLYNRYADTLARRACGLQSKRRRSEIRKQKRKAEKAAI